MLLEAILFEANIVNLDEIKSTIDGMIDANLRTTNRQIAPAVYALLIKRLIKAIQNDDTDTAATRQRIAELPDNAPSWLKNAIDRGDEVYQLHINHDFTAVLHHIIDWITDDQQAVRIIKAIPEDGFIDNLKLAADTFYAQKQKISADNETMMDEPGREIVMTFRMDSHHHVHHYMENSLAPDPQRGNVIAFWAKLTTNEALNREGYLMTHCVGSYCKDVQAQSLIIYSLRDAKNQPHATVELNLNNPADRYGVGTNRTTSPTINQVKGKGNTAPTGKYAPYIRDFLNQLGIRASSTGVGDLRGLGLLTKDGKYGTILEIGGEIEETFSNGDTIRTVEKDHNGYWYVEKNGTIPFQFFMTEVPRRREMHMAVQSVEQLRKDVNRNAIYTKNLTEYFTKRDIRPIRQAMFGFIGLYYSPQDKKWGTLEQLTVHLFDTDGISVDRLAGEITFSANGVHIATGKASADNLPLVELTVVPGAKDSLMPNLRLAVVAYIKKTSPYNEAQMGFARDYGVFPTLGGLKTEVPKDKQIFASKHGSIRAYNHRLFFYDPKEAFLGSAYIGAIQSVFVKGKGTVPTMNVNADQITTLGGNNLRNIYWLLSDLSTDEDKSKSQVNLKSFRYSHTAASDEHRAVKGDFIEQNGVLLPKSQVEFKIKVKGYTVEMEPQRHQLRLDITRPNTTDPAITAWIEDRVITRISTPGDYVSSWHEAQKVAKAMVQDRAVLAAALNHAKVKMTKRNLLDRALTIKNGKFAPQMDKDLLSFVNQRKIDLGNNFEFDRDSYSETDENLRFGSIRYTKNEHSHPTVVYVTWTYKDRTELQYRMVKNSESEETNRKAIISASAKFMKIFHDKIEPYLSNQYVGPGAGKDESDRNNFQARAVPWRSKDD